MHTVYFSYQPAEQGQESLICTRSRLWGEQWFFAFEDLIADLKDEGMPYQLIDVDMLDELPSEVA